MSVWADQKTVEVAYQMHMAGATSGQIATEISLRTGRSVSRNAVIGIIHRKGWPRSEAGTGKRLARPKPPPPPKPQQPFQRRAPRVPPEPHKPLPDIVIPEAERKSLHDLQPGDCRWPYGDPKKSDFHFCGRERVEGMAYCAVHVRRAYETPEMRRQRTSTPQRKRVLADIED